MAAWTLAERVLDDLADSVLFCIYSVVATMEPERSMIVPDNPQNKIGQFMGVGIGVGVALGVAFGMLFDNLAMGIGVGVAIGVALGAAAGTAQSDRK